MRLLASNSGFHLLWWFQRGCCQHHTSWLQEKNKKVRYERKKSCTFNISSFTHCKGISFFLQLSLISLYKHWVQDMSLSLSAKPLMNSAHYTFRSHRFVGLKSWKDLQFCRQILFPKSSHALPAAKIRCLSLCHICFFSEMPTNSLAGYDSQPLMWRGECMKLMFLGPCRSTFSLPTTFSFGKEEKMDSNKFSA